MTKPKTKYPIESFGPQLMEALVKGGREKVMIPFEGEDGKRTAHGFQRRIHTLRQRMREESHPDYLIATRARVSILWGEKAREYFPDWEADDNGHRGAVIVISPQDQQFEAALAKMKVTPIADIPEPTIDDLLVPKPELTVDDLLGELELKP